MFIVAKIFHRPICKMTSEFWISNLKQYPIPWPPHFLPPEEALKLSYVKWGNVEAMFQIADRNLREEGS
jgi:hypothetical protein